MNATTARLRVACFVDGFNLYHAVAALERPELKWLCLRTLASHFVDPVREDLGAVFYFSAIARHRGPGSTKRHEAYIQALTASDVTPELGQFKKKEITCRLCHGRFSSHEEKMTDINLAVYLTLTARDWDRALLVSGDSDFASTVRLLVGAGKSIRILNPPGRAYSRELKRASGDWVRGIKVVHLERSQLPDQVQWQGRTICRPVEWR
jgi:uncharacterized LabA/DUF88 family protein